MCYIFRDIGFFLGVTFLARPVNVETNTENRGQSNVAKVDIARLIMSCAKEILSMSSIIFSRWRHTSWSRSFVYWDFYVGKREVVWGQQWYH